MAQLSTPPLLRHSIPPSPTSSVNPNNSQFTPRKEFIREQRVISTFSLLTLSGTGAVRLYSFPAAVISALRRLFDHQNLIVSVREHASNNFFEFSLDRRPWANIKKLESEKLIVGIVSLILQHGYSFLSTIDYGREHDDCIAIAFSKPLSIPPSSSVIPLPNGSITSLPQPSRTLFAISFPSNTVLHIIDPPLHSTPAILQAVRNAWPRGVADEKKLGDSYIFKMKGYKWFQENTFATDSLRQILSLLSALDRHAFKLLTSLCLTKRSRLKDLWIFTGPTDDFPSNESAPSTPGNLSLELNREITPQSYSANVFGGGTHNPTDSHFLHTRLSTDTSPLMSSPLKQVTAPAHKNHGAVLRKPYVKPQLPAAFSSDTSINNSNLGSSLSRSSGQKRTPQASEVESMDMTGIGSGRRRAESQPRTPDIFYPNGGPSTRGNTEFDLWHRFDQMPHPPPAIVVTGVSGGPDSPIYQPAQENIMPVSHNRSFSENFPRPRTGSLGSNTPPSARARRASSPLASAAFTASQSLPLHAPSFIQTHDLDNTTRNGRALHAEEVPRTNSSSPPKEPASGAPRIPTPPLLAPGIFRDSAYSSSTGWRSGEIPTAWTGRDLEPGEERRRKLSGLREGEQRIVPQGPRERRSSRTGAEERYSSAGPAPASVPKEERRADDVATSMLPPTIKEQPSQEQDEPGPFAGRRARTPETREGQVPAWSPRAEEPQGEGARKSEAAIVGNMSSRPADAKSRPMPLPTLNGASKGASRGEPGPTPNGGASHAGSAPNGSAKARPAPVRRESEGWVLVNIEGHDKARSSTKDKGKGVAQSATRPSRRPSPNGRSKSDLRTSPKAAPQKGAGVGRSMMLPNAKAIVIVDAVGAKEREKAASGSGLRWLLPGKTRDKSSSPDPAPTPSAARRRAPQGGVTKTKMVEVEENDEKLGLRQKWKQRGTPAAAKSRDKRYSID